MPFKPKPCFALMVISLVAMTGSAAGAANERNTLPYPKRVAQNFVNACAQSAPKPICECTFKKIEKRYTLAEFVKLDARASTGQPLPDEIV